MKAYYAHLINGVKIKNFNLLICLVGFTFIWFLNQKGQSALSEFTQYGPRPSANNKTNQLSILNGKIKKGT